MVLNTLTNGPEHLENGPEHLESGPEHLENGPDQVNLAIAPTSAKMAAACICANAVAHR